MIANSRSRTKWCLLAPLCLLLLLPRVSLGEEGAAAPGVPGNEAIPPDPAIEEVGEIAEITIHDRMLVVGDAEAAERIPGSAHVIDKEDLERQGNADIHRILRQVPGINIQEEEGFGLRPNIGIRGTGVERSQKVTLLEDGVLIAPAPYAAPSAYYSPTAARMEGFEIRKGSSSIRQGPFTNGGAINYRSSSIPPDLGGSVELAGGQDGLFRGHVKVGDSRERFGWLVEGFRLQTDGFKELDNGADTGFELDDLVGKFRFNSSADSSVQQAFEIKLGKTEQDGQETYLGLTEGDYRLTPYRRYAASATDEVVTDHEQVQLTYFVKPTERLDLTATVYNNDFFRNWHKLDQVSGTSIKAILESPEQNERQIAIIRGDADSEPDELAVRNNRRDYYSRGVQLIAGLELGGAQRHDLEFGLRVHEDQEDRFQEDDLYQMVDGEMELTGLGAPGSNSNRVSDAEAVALFAQDTFQVGQWTLSPGLRYETIDLSGMDYGKTDPDRSGEALQTRTNEVDVWIPGVGADYQTGASSSAFVGVHKGFAPPAPGSADEVEAEESWNFEAGYRVTEGTWSAEVVGFFNDYDNLLGTDTLSGGGDGTGDQFNGGAVEVMGLEASISRDFAGLLGTSLTVPVRLVYTYTQAEFQTNFKTTFADWAPEVELGDELPYLPAHQLFGSISLVAARWGAHLDLSWMDEMRTNAGQGSIPREELIPSRFLVDLGGDYQITPQLKAYARVRNLTDEIYLAARRPAGLRPGMPQTVVAGFSFGF